MRVHTVRIGDIRGACVYACFRGARLLYIGRSAKGVSRPLSHDHAYLKDAEPDDEMTIWMCGSKEEAAQLEQRLIEQFKPELNPAPVRPWSRMRAAGQLKSQQAVS
jgi:hypothetical protein